MREATIEEYLENGVEQLGGQCWKFVSPGRKGVMDRLVILPYLPTIYVECKAPNGKLSPSQVRRKAELEALGHEVHVLHTLQAVGQFLSKCAKLLNVQQRAAKK